MLNTTIKPFQKFPMWLTHPDQKPGNMLQPIVVHTEEQTKQYLARGYVAPEIDEQAWMDSQFQIHLAKQMIAVMTGAARAQEVCMGVQYTLGQLETEIEILNARFDARLKKLGFKVQRKAAKKPKKVTAKKRPNYRSPARKKS